MIKDLKGKLKTSEVSIDKNLFKSNYSMNLKSMHVLKITAKKHIVDNYQFVYYFECYMSLYVSFKV